MITNLHEFLEQSKIFCGDRDCYLKKVPAHIGENLNKRFPLRRYQLEALGRLRYIVEDFSNREYPLRALFHMATGSGKTLLMAGSILYLYQFGYRNFLFFVNRDNIIHQTRQIFLNPSAQKYLFGDAITLNGRKVSIEEVNTFRAGDSNSVRMLFTTVQGLHSVLNNPREDSVTYEELEELDVVLISDEAHHLNVSTTSNRNRQQSMLGESIDPSWEQTIERIFESNPENILLEFTATMNFSNEAIRKKYLSKLILDYPLREFRLDGYSKEVKVLQSDVGTFERAIQAMVINQFRLKIFEKYALSIKPVILFKSKTIVDSRSFQAEFFERLKVLSGDDIKNLISGSNVDPVFSQLANYLSKNSISLENLAIELREDFSQHKCISIDSKSESESNQIAVNNLEDVNNEYRAVFAVDKLNEGWDVLNLFDIVRLYNTRDGKDGLPGSTTISEAQLIGRGARYCPFIIEKHQPKFQRKYDSTSNDEELNLHLCEVLYYHSAQNPKYISELKSALVETGILPSRSIQRDLKLKSNFKNSKFYKCGKIFLNKQVKDHREHVHCIDQTFLNEIHPLRLRTGYSQSEKIFSTDEIDFKGTDQLTSSIYAINTFGIHLIRKALNRVPELHFNYLKVMYPRLRSIREFIESENYLGRVKCQVEGTSERVFSLNQDDKLDLTVELLEKLAKNLRNEKKYFRGTRQFRPHRIEQTFFDKTLCISQENFHQERGCSQKESLNDDLRLDLSNREWYVFNDCYGTSEEKHFVKLMDQFIQEIEKKFANCYLFRNERHLGIYNFDDGRKFEPDFVLFLLNENFDSGMQVFVEPKGKHLLEEDRWKEELMKQLKSNHELEFIENKDFILLGLPFFNKEKPDKFNEFVESFRQEVLKIE